MLWGEHGLRTYETRRIGGPHNDPRTTPCTSLDQAKLSSSLSRAQTACQCAERWTAPPSTWPGRGAPTAAITLTILSLTCVSNAAAQSAIVAADSMNRTVPTGIRHGGCRGRHTRSRQRVRLHVSNHAGVLGPIVPGHAVSATLPKTALRDVAVRTTVQLTAATSSGSGVYFYTLLRALPNELWPLRHAPRDAERAVRAPLGNAFT